MKKWIARIIVGIFILLVAANFVGLMIAFWIVSLYLTLGAIGLIGLVMLLIWAFDNC